MNLPEAFEQRIRADFGPEADAFLSALERDPQTSIRLNPRKGRLPWEGRNIPWVTNGYWLPERPVFALDPLFHAGSYYVQEASSMFLEQAFQQLVLPAHPLILDLCAAPGGKSTHLLSLLDGKGLLVSNEVIKSRNAILRENIIKWGYHNVVVTQNNPADFQRSSVRFDAVVVDAPCSGEGMFRKDKASRDEWSPDHVNLCSLRQHRILADIWPMVKPGGYLIYSTCAFNRWENEDQVMKLVDEGGAELISWDQADETIIHRNPGFAFYPHRTDSEGFFLAVLQKRGQLEDREPKRSSIRPVKNPMWIELMQDEIGTAIDWRENVHFVPADALDVLEDLNRWMFVTHVGTVLGQEIRNKPQFDHGFAMSVLRRDDAIETMELTHDDALNFLRKQVSDKSGKTSKWVLATYKGIGLGLLKDAGNRWNNYYPTNYRLRMGS